MRFVSHRKIQLRPRAGHEQFNKLSDRWGAVSRRKSQTFSSPWVSSRATRLRRLCRPCKLAYVGFTRVLARFTCYVVKARQRRYDTLRSTTEYINLLFRSSSTRIASSFSRPCSESSYSCTSPLRGRPVKKGLGDPLNFPPRGQNSHPRRLLAGHGTRLCRQPLRRAS